MWTSLRGDFSWIIFINFTEFSELYCYLKLLHSIFLPFLTPSKYENCKLVWQISQLPSGLSLAFSSQAFPMRSNISDLSKQSSCLPLATAAAKTLQSYPTLCDPRDCSPPGSPVPGILQARALEWVAISFSNALKWKVKGKSLSRIWLFVTPWTAAHQAPLSMGFSWQEYWSGVPLPSPIYVYIYFSLAH